MAKNGLFSRSEFTKQIQKNIGEYVMTLTHAMWVHGHSMQIESEDQLYLIRRTGMSIIIGGNSGNYNWFHFAIPTPVIVNGNRLRADSVMVRFKSASADAFVTAIHVYDGEKRIAMYENLHLNPNNWEWPRFDVPGHPEILWGVGISIQVGFGVENVSHKMEFSSAGCDFI